MTTEELARELWVVKLGYDPHDRSFDKLSPFTKKDWLRVAAHVQEREQTLTQQRDILLRQVNDLEKQIVELRDKLKGDK